MDTWGLRMLFPHGVSGHSIRGLLWVGGASLWRFQYVGPQGSSQSLGFPQRAFEGSTKAHSILMNGENNLRLQSPFPQSREHPDTPFFSVES